MKTKKLISEYAESIMEEYSNLHFIAFNDEQILAISKNTKKVHFFYKVNEDMSFHFNLLSEVGECYQYWFKETLKQLNYTLKAKETETDYYEIISNY